MWDRWDAIRMSVVFDYINKNCKICYNAFVMCNISN